MDDSWSWAPLGDFWIRIGQCYNPRKKQAHRDFGCRGFDVFKRDLPYSSWINLWQHQIMSLQIKLLKDMCNRWFYYSLTILEGWTVEILSCDTSAAINLHRGVIDRRHKLSGWLVGNLCWWHVDDLFWEDMGFISDPLKKSCMSSNLPTNQANPCFPNSNCENQPGGNLEKITHTNSSTIDFSSFFWILIEKKSPICLFIF